MREPQLLNIFPRVAYSMDTKLLEAAFLQRAAYACKVHEKNIVLQV